MAEIRRTSRSNPLSNYQQTAPDGGSAFRVLADVANQAYDFIKPAAIEEMQQRAETDFREVARRDMANNRVPLPPAPRAQGDLSGVGRNPTATTSTRGSTAISSGVVTSPVTTTPLSDTSSWLEYRNQGARRNDPLSNDLTNAMAFLPDLGVRMVVTSGGQESVAELRAQGMSASEIANHRTGSTRHDHGNAADADFFLENGTKLVPSNPAHRPIMQEIVRRARANGVTGFGEGADYMGEGRVHLGYGSEAIWGAGGRGENAPDWLREAYENPNNITSFVQSAQTNEAAAIGADTRAALGISDAPLTGAAGDAQTQGGSADDTLGVSDPVVTPPAAPTTEQAPSLLQRVAQSFIRTSDGSREARMFSPMSGEILQAYNAAASQAYISEAMLSGREDLMNLSETHIGNPAAFQEATSGYIDSIVDQADPMLQRDLRATLQREGTERYLGMVDQQHRETRQRASNSNNALIERTSSDYAEALSIGDAGAAEQSRRQLEDLLYARQSIPGLSWTPEQSENVILGAMQSAERLTSQRRTQENRETTNALKLIIEARRDGLVGADEAILTDPAVRAEHPELVSEAEAHIFFQQSLPTFNQMSIPDQVAMLEDMRANPIEAGYDIDLIKAAESVVASNARAWEADPIAAATRFLPDNPPPTVDFSQALTDPEAFTESLAARTEYGTSLQQDGYINSPAFFSEGEAEALQVMLGEDTLPEARVAIAQTLVEGLGAGSQAALNSIDMDPVLNFGAQLMAAGDAANVAGLDIVATMALQGQELINTGQVKLPTGADRIATFAPAVASAMAGMRNAGAAQEQIVKFAQSLYAANAQGLDPASDEAKAAMTDAVNIALGQSTNARGEVTGGVQDVGGHSVLLPVGMSGEAVAAELFTSEPPRWWMRGPGSTAPEQRVFDMERWAASNGGGQVPMWGDAPMPANIFRSGNVRLVAIGETQYRMEVQVGGRRSDISTSNGGVFTFDLNAYMEGAQ